MKIEKQIDIDIAVEKMASAVRERTVLAINASITRKVVA